MPKVSGYTNPKASWNGSLSQGVKKYDRYWGPNRTGGHEDYIGGYDGLTFIKMLSFNFKIKHNDTSLTFLWRKEGIENFGMGTLVAWADLKVSNATIIFEAGKYVGGKYSGITLVSSAASVAVGEWVDITLVIDIENMRSASGIMMPHPCMQVYKNGTLVEMVGNIPNIWTGALTLPPPPATERIYSGEPWVDLSAAEGYFISHTGISYFFQNTSSRPTSTLTSFRVYGGTLLTAAAAAANVRAPSIWEFLAYVTPYPPNYIYPMWEFSVDNYGFVPIPWPVHNPPGFQNFGEVFGYEGAYQGDPVYMWYGLDEGPPLLGDNYSPPLLVSPVNYATGSELNTTFVWGGVYGATSYVLQTSTDSLFTTNVRTRYTTSISYVMNDPPFDMQTSYYWKVAVIVGVATGSAFSSPNIFTTGNFLNFSLTPTMSKTSYYFDSGITKSVTSTYPTESSSGSIA